MTIAEMPQNEADRLLKLKQHEILDTLPEREFDDLTYLASFICGTPIALITLLDDKRQWFKSRQGTEQKETSRDISFCSHAILQNDVMMVPDSLKDPRFKDNPMVVGDPHIRFYAGAPITTAEGYNLGTLCVLDNTPRGLNRSQVMALEALARQVVSQLELRQFIRHSRKN